MHATEAVGGRHFVHSTEVTTGVSTVLVFNFTSLASQPYFSASERKSEGKRENAISVSLRFFPFARGGWLARLPLHHIFMPLVHLPHVHLHYISLVKEANGSESVAVYALPLQPPNV